MSLILAAAMAAVPVSMPACSWDRPGHNPFVGDVVAAVDRYTDIPAATRARLKKRMSARDYDEIVSIRRDAIVGKARYNDQIYGMHFGTGQTCGTVSRARWSADAQERGLVYCEDGHCILVPTVCRNVSRIHREAAAVGPAAAGIGPATGDAGGPGVGGLAGGASPGLAAAPAADASVAGLDGVPSGQDAPGSFARGARTALPDTGGLGAADLGSPAIGPATAGDGAVVGADGGGAGSSAGGTTGGAGAPVDSVPWLGGGVPTGGVPGGVVGALPIAGIPAADILGPISPGFDPNLVGAIPEPGSWALMAVGLLALLGWRRRSQR